MKKRKRGTKKKQKFNMFNIRIKNFLKENKTNLACWCLLSLIIALSFYYRIQPYKYKYLLAIDPYLFYRHVWYAITHPISLPHLDIMEYYPTGVNPYEGLIGLQFFLALLYLILTKIGINISYLSYAKLEPAIMGGLLFPILIYLLGKELYNRKAGLISAFFYATATGLMFRTSAGFFEKEPNAGFFMLLSFYFFVRALRRNSIFAAVSSGLSLALMATMWGGVQQLYLSYALVAFALLFVNNVSDSFKKTYLVVVFIGCIPLILHRYSLTTVMITVNIMALVLLFFREIIIRKRLVTQHTLNYLMPTIYFFGLLILMIGGFFSSTIASILMGIKHYLFYQQGLVESTVAENVIPTWNDFIRDTSLYYLNNYAKDSILKNVVVDISGLFPFWLLAFAGIILLAFSSVKKGKILESITEKHVKVCVLFLSLISLFSYGAFLKVQGSYIAQVLFIFPFIGVIFLISKYNEKAAIYLAMSAVAMLGYFTRVRWMFGVSIMFSLMAGYFGARSLEFIGGLLRKFSEMLDSGENYQNMVGWISYGLLIFIIGVVTVAYALNANIIAKSLAPSFNQNWDEAMKFLRENTEPNATVLSWWDFGYWFQTMGNRSTNLDGSNAHAERNIPTAQYFTGMMNETQQKFFLEMMGTDYVLVDASMVGKYAAMSKIAQMITKREDYDKIRSYNYFYLDKNQIYRKGNATVYVYRSGLYSIWVPVNDNGSLAGSILFMSPMGEGYIKYVCTSDRIYMLNVPENRPALDACVIITPNILLLATEDMFNSVFHKLFFMDGKGIDYLTKVFDNGEVKIYKVNHTIIPDRPREQLVKWWEKYDWKGLIVYNGTARVSQAMDYSVFEE